MAIFSGRLEDWDNWKRDIESFIGAKDPEMADIIVGLTKLPISGDEVKSYDEKNVKGYFTLKKYLKGAAANLIEKLRSNKDGSGAFQALTDKYELRGETQKASLMSEFSNLHFDENGDLRETCEAAEELARKNKHRFDMEIDEPMLLTHLINKFHRHVEFNRLPRPMLGLLHTRRKVYEVRCLSGRGNGRDLNVHITCMNESFLPFVVCVAEKLSETRVRTMVRFFGEKVIEWNTVF
jgi:hypothetical protein